MQIQIAFFQYLTAYPDFVNVENKVIDEKVKFYIYCSFSIRVFIGAERIEGKIVGLQHYLVLLKFFLIIFFVCIEYKF